MNRFAFNVDWRSVGKAMMMLALLIALFYAQASFADTCSSTTGSTGSSGNPTIGTLADNLDSTFGSLAKLLTAAAYILGIGFVLAAIFKFKAHKDSPQQVPIGGPIALLFIGIAMVFMPSVVSTTGTTIFGTSGSVGTVSGVCTFGNFSSTSGGSGS